MVQSPCEGYQLIDPDSKMNPYTINAALRVAGAADLAIKGSVSNALYYVQLPVHHTEHNATMGLFFFNNVTVCIRDALDVYGLKRIALIDFDVRHGNGSEAIFRGDDHVMMCPIFEQGTYPFITRNLPEKRMINIGLPSCSKSNTFRGVVGQHWIPGPGEISVENDLYLRRF